MHQYRNSYQEIQHVLPFDRVTKYNSVVTVEGNECTGALPGKMLRTTEIVG